VFPAVTGAFAAVAEDPSAQAAAAAYLGSGPAGCPGCTGPGSLQLALLDKLYNLTEKEEFSGTPADAAGGLRVLWPMVYRGWGACRWRCGEKLKSMSSFRTSA